MNNPSNLFDSYYYQHDCGLPYERNDHWLNFFSGIAQRIVSEISPETVLDAGCAKGFLVEGLRNAGVQAWGIDISQYAIENVHDTIKPYCKVASITDPFPQEHYDLIVSIEVLEHMPPQEADAAIRNLCNHTNQILFSSTPFDYKEVTHVNVQAPEYWAGIFAKNGFYRDFEFDASFVTPWAVKFEKKNLHQMHLIREYERRYFQMWKENVDLRQLSLEIQTKIKEMELINSRIQGELDAIYSSETWKC